MHARAEIAAEYLPVGSFYVMALWTICGVVAHRPHELPTINRHMRGVNPEMKSMPSPWRLAFVSDTLLHLQKNAKRVMPKSEPSARRAQPVGHLLRMSVWTSS